MPIILFKNIFLSGAYKLGNPPLRIHTYKLLSIILFLPACSTKMDHAKIEIFDDLSTSAQVLLSASDFPGSKEISEGRKTLKEHEKMAELCGASTRVLDIPSKSETILEIISNRVSRDELEAMTKCFANIEMANTNLTVYKSNNIFWTTYHTELTFDLPYPSPPNELSFILPGKISYYSNNSRPSIYIFSTKKSGDDRIIYYYQGINDKKNINEEIMEDIKPEKCGNLKWDECDLTEEEKKAMLTHRLKFVIESRVNKYDLSIISSLLGLVFGTGIIYEAKKNLPFLKTKIVLFARSFVSFIVFLSALGTRIKKFFIEYNRIK